MPEYYELHAYGEVSRVMAIASNYVDDGSLAVVLVRDDGSPYANVTVCLSESASLPGNQAFVDTNNDPWAPAFLKENGIASPAGKSARSGWCDYPLYEFDLEKLQTHI